MPNPDQKFPAAGGQSEKLQKVLARAGVGSRRQMEDWIRAGRVAVNGTKAGLGSRVGRGDSISIDGRPLRPQAAARLPRVLLYHKPEGEIVSRDDPARRPSVFDRLPRLRDAKWLAVGRLDFNTCGLLLLTTSGELANQMMHPRYELAREYAVRIRGRISDEQMAQLRSGVRLKDGPARCDSIEDQGGEGANRWYRIELHEGRNRIVRRLFEALGLTVSRLMRVRFGPVSLPPRLARGEFVQLPPELTRELLAAVGLSSGAEHLAAEPAEAPKGQRRRGRNRNR